MYKKLLELLQHQTAQLNLLITLAVTVVLTIIVIPLPTIALDFLIIISIMISLTILMVVFFLEKAIDFTSFPNILLLATVFRLALNFASTRLILTKGYQGIAAAGQLIKTTGVIFMQGNPLIGCIFFIVLTTINFIIITKGSNRMAEVAARFALDSLPGKQMSIEADLSAGVINEIEAKERRDNLQIESSFYGAMDGASKFIRGDAIASIIITIINGIGGILVGVTQKNITFIEAFNTYMILTIGDSLISQIPALIISFSAAILISRTSSKTAEYNFENTLAYIVAIKMVSLIILLLGFVPGMPWYLCFPLSAVTFLLSNYYEEHKLIKKNDQPQAKEKSESFADILEIKPVEVRISHDLLYLLEKETEENLLEKITLLKKNMAKGLGIILPNVNISSSIDMESSSYEILFKEVSLAKQKVVLNKYMAISSNNQDLMVKGKETTDPVWKIKAKWIDPVDEYQAIQEEAIIVNISSLITTHLQELIKQNIGDLVSFSTIKNLISNLDSTYQKFYDEIVPDKISLSTIQKIIIYLVQEDVSVKDLGYIIEALHEASDISKDAKTLSEFIRIKLSKQICSKYVQNDKLYIIDISPQWEFKTSNGQIILSPTRIEKFISKVQNLINKNNSLTLVLITDHIIRRYVKEILVQNYVNIPVISEKGIDQRLSIQHLGRID